MQPLDRSPLEVRVPAGAHGGRRLTARGKGLPGRPPADLDLVVQLVPSSAHDPRARRLYEPMTAELGGFDALLDDALRRELDRLRGR